MALEKDSTDLVEAVLSKSWDELEALEFDGELLFPSEVIRKKGSGWEHIPVLLKVPRENTRRAARMRARAWAAEEGLDPELDPDFFDNMDTMCLLSECIRNVKAPHEPWEPFPETLEKKYDRASLDAVWALIDAYSTVVDPRPNSVTEEQMLAVIGAVAKARNIVPLAAFAGESQNNCVVTMAQKLQSFLGSK